MEINDEYRYRGLDALYLYISYLLLQSRDLVRKSKILASNVAVLWQKLVSACCWLAKLAGWLLTTVLLIILPVIM